jgi:hypothetical protein
MDRGYWLSLVLLTNYIVFEILSFIVSRRAWCRSSSDLSFGMFHRLALRFNLRRNFGLDDLRDPVLHDHLALHTARRHCIMLAQAHIWVQIITILVFASAE